MDVENRKTIEQILEYAEKLINLNRDNVWASWKAERVSIIAKVMSCNYISSIIQFKV